VATLARTAPARDLGAILPIGTTDHGHRLAGLVEWRRGSNSRRGGLQPVSARRRVRDGEVLPAKNLKEPAGDWAGRKG
jgi:chromosome condensin MukBEF MukE localization factor